MKILPGHEHRCGVNESVNRFFERADITIRQISAACDAALLRRLGFLPDVSVKAVMNREVARATRGHQP